MDHCNNGFPAGELPREKERESGSDTPLAPFATLCEASGHTESLKRIGETSGQHCCPTAGMVNIPDGGVPRPGGSSPRHGRAHATRRAMPCRGHPGPAPCLWAVAATAGGRCPTAGMMVSLVRPDLRSSPYAEDHKNDDHKIIFCLLYTSPSPRDVEESRMPSSA